MRFIAVPALWAAASLLPGPASAWSERDWEASCPVVYTAQAREDGHGWTGGTDCWFNSDAEDAPIPVAIRPGFLEQVERGLKAFSGWYDGEGWDEPSIAADEGLPWPVYLDPSNGGDALADYAAVPREITVYMDLDARRAEIAADRERTVDIGDHDGLGPRELVTPTLKLHTLAHEMVHAMVRERRASSASLYTEDPPLPGWIDEGIPDAIGKQAVMAVGASLGDYDRAEIAGQLWKSDYAEGRFSRHPLTFQDSTLPAYGTEAFWTHVYLDHFEGHSGDLGRLFDYETLLGTDGGTPADTFFRRETDKGLTEVWLDFLARASADPAIHDALPSFFDCKTLTATLDGGADWTHEDAKPTRNLQARCLDITVAAQDINRRFHVEWDEADDPRHVHHIVTAGEALEDEQDWLIPPGAEKRFIVLLSAGEPDRYDAETQASVPVTFRLQRDDACDPQAQNVRMNGDLPFAQQDPLVTYGDTYFSGGPYMLAEGPASMQISGTTTDQGTVCSVLVGATRQPVIWTGTPMLNAIETALSTEYGSARWNDMSEPQRQSLRDARAAEMIAAHGGWPADRVTLILDGMGHISNTSQILRHGGVGGWMPDSDALMSVTIFLDPSDLKPGTYPAQSATGSDWSPYRRIVRGEDAGDELGFRGTIEGIGLESQALSGEVTIEEVEGGFVTGRLELSGPGTYGTWTRTAHWSNDCTAAPPCVKSDTETVDQPTAVTVTATFRAGFMRL
ncbi:hypothetical protein [Pelagovum pacificum]|uniref:Uncharacterized protein n=1 Tax=Pelagovum pacificum TaxID=2588711 RepID=A0A5C5GDY8_9RHOB|nr:hypothetical protein [Pelagovum pacificum]QQA44165.1 hypothetical protein I8N54_06185 [Pelagovum pacificum]TNY32710.1 hypothetical protein FHY64_05380 [Pelagovum pacificum]